VLAVDLVAADEIAPPVADWSGRKAADQRHIVLFVVLDECPGREIFPLRQKGHDLEHPGMMIKRSAMS